ncbi:MAG: DUF4249 family protein [Sphingobacteriales bacterium]|nr:MAG: DUF4249 family protein [Sphingobacteriales bacterium]
MSIKHYFSIALLIPLFFSCRPKPLDIEVAQKPGKLTISSVAFSEKSVFIAAGYSVESGFNLADTTEKNRQTLPGRVVDSGLVTITKLGCLPDTLKMYNPGIYGNNNLQLTPYAQYILTVMDYKKGTAVSATTTYLPAPSIQALKPEVIKTGSQPVVKLHIKLGDIKPGEHFFIGYSTKTNVISAITPLVAGLGAMQSFEARQLEMVDGSKAKDGMLEHSFTLDVKPTDTLTVQVAKIDDKYYKYLDAYKRTGYLLNQISGEPINLPTNVSAGLGYFALYAPQRTRFYLNEF